MGSSPSTRATKRYYSVDCRPNEAEMIGASNSNNGGSETAHAALSSASTFIAAVSCIWGKTCE